MLPRRGQGRRELVALLLCQRQLAGGRRRERGHGLHQLVDRRVLQETPVDRAQLVELAIAGLVPAVHGEPLRGADDVDQQVIAAAAEPQLVIGDVLAEPGDVPTLLPLRAWR